MNILEDRLKIHKDPDILKTRVNQIRWNVIGMI